MSGVYDAVADAVGQYGAVTPVLYTALSVAVFAYLSTLLALIIDSLSRRWAAVSPTIGTIVSCVTLYMSWRCGILAPTCVVYIAFLFVHQATALRQSPYAAVGPRILAAFCFVTAQCFFSTPLTLMHLPTADAQLSGLMHIGADVTLLESYFSSTGITIPYRGVSLRFGSPSTEITCSFFTEPEVRCATLAVYSDYCLVEGGVWRDGPIVVLGRSVRLQHLRIVSSSSDTAAHPRVYAALGTTLFDLIIGDHRVNETTVSAELCLSPPPWLFCVESGGLQSLPRGVHLSPPLWLELEEQAPVLMSLVVPAAQQAAYWAMEAASLLLDLYAEVAVHASGILVEVNRVVPMMVSDVMCAAQAAFSLPPASTECSSPPNYALLHHVSYHAIRVTWVIGLPAVWDCFVQLLEWDRWCALWLLRSTVSLIRASLQNQELAALMWSLTRAASIMTSWAAAAADFGFEWYRYHVAWHLRFHRLVATEVVSLAGTVLGLVLQLLNPFFAVLWQFWDVYSDTSFPSEIAASIVQTTLIVISFRNELKLRMSDAATNAQTSLMFLGMKQISALAGIVTEHGPQLVSYAVAHAVASMAVLGSGLLSFLPLVSTLVVHVGFPVSSTQAALRLFNRQDQWMLFAMIFFVRACVVVLFHFTIGGVVYGIITELLKPVVIGGLLLLSLRLGKGWSPRFWT